MPINVFEETPLTDWTDEQLLEDYRESQDRDVFQVLVTRYQRELYCYLYNYLGNAEMAQDVFQATFLQVHLKCDQFEPGRKVRPWLYTVAMHQAIDAQRRNKRHQRTLSLDQTYNEDMDHDNGSLSRIMGSDEEDPVRMAESTEQGQLVREALEQLPETLREATRLVFFQGMKYREAAEVLSVPVGTVKSRVHTAFKRLAEILTDAGMG